VPYVFPGSTLPARYERWQWECLVRRVRAPADADRADGRTADITDTTITGTAGTYRLTVYLVDTTADITAGAVTVHLKWNDGSAAQDVAVGPIVLTTVARWRRPPLRPIWLRET